MRTTASNKVHRKSVGGNSVRAKSVRAKSRMNNRVVAAMLVGITVLIVGLIAVSNWATGRPADPETPVTAVDPDSLLALAAPVNPIVGGHDMANIPDMDNVQATTLAADIPQANVDLPLQHWDWGMIPAAPPVVQTFPIQNTGDKSLLITNVVTSCGCTVAALSSSVIPPGERADLKVTFDPNFHGTVGPVSRIVWLETNDPDMPVVELRVDANVSG